MSSMEWGTVVLDVLGGIAALLVGMGVFIACLALAKTLVRIRATLDEVDRQLAGIGAPVTSTLSRVDELTKSLEQTAGTVSRTVDLTRSAVVPGIVNVGAAIAGVTAGLRRLVTGKDSKD
ncbi:MAG TPA: hypothetical protein VHR97_04350 [Candidatus Baltobacteraceae bacterium]|nr:hypothetical protein [Candidatus Baltobacteraceae bacterium]